MLVLLFSSILVSFVGCKESQDKILSDKQKLVEQLNNDANVDNGTIEFTAQPLAQDVALSWVYSIDVKVTDGNIYLNDILYDNVSYVNDLNITYSEGLLGSANKDEEISEILNEIKNYENCCILETDSDSKFGRKIALYDIEGICYFVSFYENGEVMRIHHANIKWHYNAVG